MLNNPLILIPLSAGIIFIIAGYVMYKFPPKAINSLYGYRTKSSMQSKAHWNFSQHYSSKAMMITGLLLACTSLLGLQFDFGKNTNSIIALSLMILSIIIMFWRVEVAISKKFKNK